MQAGMLQRMQTFDERLGARVRRFRHRAGYSQEKLADIVSRYQGLDLHPTAITRIESGRRRVTAEELYELATALGVNVDALLDSKDPSRRAYTAAQRVCRAEQQISDLSTGLHIAYGDLADVLEEHPSAFEGALRAVIEADDRRSEEEARVHAMYLIGVAVLCPFDGVGLDVGRELDRFRRAGEEALQEWSARGKPQAKG